MDTQPNQPVPPPQIYLSHIPRRKGLPVWAIVLICVVSGLFACIIGLVIYSFTPAGQQFFAQIDATQTAQAISDANAHATATSYAVTHPQPTKTSAPYATVSPQPNLTVTPTSTTKPIPTLTPIPTPTPLTSIPPTFMGLGGNQNAYIKYFGTPDFQDLNSDIWDRVDINNEGPFGQVASVLLLTWTSGSQDIASQVTINNPDYLSGNWNNDIQATAEKLCDGMRPPDSLKIKTFSKGADTVIEYNSVLFGKLVLRLFPGTKNADIVYVEYVMPNDGCIVTSDYLALD